MTDEEIEVFARIAAHLAELVDVATRIDERLEGLNDKAVDFFVTLETEKEEKGKR